MKTNRKQEKIKSRNNQESFEEHKNVLGEFISALPSDHKKKTPSQHDKAGYAKKHFERYVQVLKLSATGHDLQDSELF